MFLQIRFLMKSRESWKLNFDEILPMVTLHQPVTKKELEMHLYLLADYEFVNVTMPEDDEASTEVEIAVGRQQAMLQISKN